MNILARVILRTAFGLSVLLVFSFVNGVVAAQNGGADLYKAKCAACHGADGKGATAVGKADGIRDLGSAAVQAQSDTALTAIVASGKGKMPAYGKSLKPEQIASLVTYIRSLASR
jgi:cytochrome c6